MSWISCKLSSMSSISCMLPKFRFELLNYFTNVQNKDINATCFDVILQMYHEIEYVYVFQIFIRYSYNYILCISLETCEVEPIPILFVF